MNYPFDTVGLNGEQIDLFQETYETLKTRYSVELSGNIDFQLSDFEVFRDCVAVNIKGSFTIKSARSDCYLLFVETSKLATRGNRSPERVKVVEYQVWALAFTKKDFGRVLIRPETLVDKIIELVHPVELDFDEDKAFSDTYYVLVNDRWKADVAMDRNFRNVALDVRHEDIVIEVIDHTLIIGYGKPVSPETAMNLADFVVRLCNNC